MDMATVIMRNKGPALFIAKPALLASCLVGSVYAYADFKIQPSLALDSHGYHIREDHGGTDRGASLSVAPTLDFYYSTGLINSSLQLQNQSVVYRDSQRDDTNYFSYQAGNALRLLNDNLSIDFKFSQDYRATGTAASRFQDQINSPDSQVKSNNEALSIGYENDRLDWFVINSNVSANRTAVDTNADITAVDPNQLQYLSNQNYVGNFEFQSRDRSRKFFWAGQLSATKIDRDALEDFDTERGSLIFGFPFFANIAMVARGEYEDNSSNPLASDIYSDYQSYRTIGGGLEWQISQYSFWNVTFNKVNNADVTTEYIGTEFRLVPSRHTKITGSLDRRFFGRTAEITANYELKNFRMELKLGDSVGSLLALSAADNQVGLFICPPGVTPGLDNCFQPPTSQYQPRPGEQYYNITIPGDDLSELLVVRRQASLQIGYDFNRLKLTGTIGQRKDDFLEGRQQRDDKYANVAANWQLNQRNSITLSADSSRQDNVSATGQFSGFGFGDSDSASLEWSRQLNRSLSGKLKLKRLLADDELSKKSFEETRLSLGFNYIF
jgi:uncharacterized protein (PEP-CTERM system associated)